MLLALSLAGLGVAALLGSAVLVMLKGAVVLAFFVWVAAVASRRYGHGFWPRSDVGGIGYTVAVEVVRKPLLTLLVVLGLGLGVTGIVSSIFLILSILACMGVCIALGRRVEGVRDTVRQWRHAPRKSRATRASGALAATQLPHSKRAIGGSQADQQPRTPARSRRANRRAAPFCQAVASDRPGRRRGACGSGDGSGAGNVGYTGSRLSVALSYRRQRCTRTAFPRQRPATRPAARIGRGAIEHLGCVE